MKLSPRVKQLTVIGMIPLLRVGFFQQSAPKFRRLFLVVTEDQLFIHYRQPIVDNDFFPLAVAPEVEMEDA